MLRCDMVCSRAPVGYPVADDLRVHFKGPKPSRPKVCCNSNVAGKTSSNTDSRKSQTAYRLCVGRGNLCELQVDAGLTPMGQSKQRMVDRNETRGEPHCSTVPTEDTVKRFYLVGERITFPETSTVERRSEPIDGIGRPTCRGLFPEKEGR